jgi:hypothetical protein
MSDTLASDSFPYFGEEHAMLRTTLRRFIADRVLPNGDAWEEQGFVPREVLREMGSLGLLGMRYAPEHGGAGPRLRSPTSCSPRSWDAAPTAASRSPCWCTPTWPRRTSITAGTPDQLGALDARHHCRPQDHGRWP